MAVASIGALSLEKPLGVPVLRSVIRVRSSPAGSHVYVVCIGKGGATPIAWESLAEFRYPDCSGSASSTRAAAPPSS